MIRSAIKSGLKKVLGREEVVPPPPAPAWRAEAPKAAPVEVAPAPVVAVAPVVEAAPVVAPVATGPSTGASAVGASAPAPVVAAPLDDVVSGPALTFEAVQEIVDEMVRPALQGDGGDMTLIKVEDNNVYVKLVGSCSTCPSSIMTMKLGVEALLKEEFPSMDQLIQVD